MKTFNEFILESKTSPVIQKEETLGTFITDTADLLITGNPKAISDKFKKEDFEYLEDVLNMSLGSDGKYQVVKRWYETDDKLDNVPDEVVIIIKKQ